MTPKSVTGGTEGLPGAQRGDREDCGSGGQQGEGHRRDVAFDRLAGRCVVRGAGHRPGRGRRGHGGGGGRSGRGRRRLRCGGLRHGLRYGLRYGFRRRRGWRRGRGWGRGRRRSGLGRRGRRRRWSRLRRGFRRRRRRGLRRAGRGRRWRAVVSVPAVSAVSAVPAVSVVSVGVSAVPVVSAAVMSATRAASAATAGGRGDQGGGGGAVAVADRRVGAAISHGRGDGEGGPQQDRDRQQASGTGFVHPGSMGSRMPAHARVRPGSPERVECQWERFKPLMRRQAGESGRSSRNSQKGCVGIDHSPGRVRQACLVCDEERIANFRFCSPRWPMISTFGSDRSPTADGPP